MLYIKLKEIINATTWWQIFCPQTLGLDQMVKILFLEHGRVAYQINGNHECRNMVAIILPADPGVGSKFNFFSEHGHVAYQINGNH